MSLALPSMRRRMQRREEMLHIALAPNGAATTSSQKQQQQQTLRQGNSFDTLAPSFATSTCSEPSILTDYGLHRAVNAPIVVPNEQNPIATVKDRKNANYIEGLSTRHSALKAELDGAIAAFNEVTNLRDRNKVISLENMLNRKFLDANNLLARRSREYSCFLHDIQELQQMPKMSREELARRFTDQKAKEKASRQENDMSAMEQQMRTVEGQIADLELEREDLIKRTGAVDALAEQVAYVEHLNESLMREKSQILRRFARKERLCGKHIHAVDQLAEDIAYYEHLNAQKDRDNAELTRDLENTTRANQTMQHDLEHQRNHAVNLSDQLHNTQNDIRNYQSHLNYAKMTAMQLKDENKDLRREVQQLNNMCHPARVELADLNDENERLKVERERMQEMREMQRETNAHLRHEFDEMHDQAANHIKKNVHFEAKNETLESEAAAIKAENAGLSGYAEKLKAELAILKSRAWRRDSVVSDSTDGEAKRSASA